MWFRIFAMLEPEVLDIQIVGFAQRWLVVAGAWFLRSLSGYECNGTGIGTETVGTVTYCRNGTGAVI
jgi:hypothetical protein